MFSLFNILNHSNPIFFWKFLDLALFQVPLSPFLHALQVLLLDWRNNFICKFYLNAYIRLRIPKFFRDADSMLLIPSFLLYYQNAVNNSFIWFLNVLVLIQTIRFVNVLCYSPDWECLISLEIALLMHVDLTFQQSWEIAQVNIFPTCQLILFFLFWVKVWMLILAYAKWLSSYFILFVFLFFLGSTAVAHQVRINFAQLM